MTWWDFFIKLLVFWHSSIKYIRLITFLQEKNVLFSAFSIIQELQIKVLLDFEHYKTWFFEPLLLLVFLGEMQKKTI